MSSPSTTTHFVPHRRTRRGAFGETTIIAMATGMARRPASSGEYPSTNWKYWMRRNTEP